MFSYIYSKEFNVLYYRLIMGLIGDLLSLSYSVDKIRCTLNGDFSCELIPFSFMHYTGRSLVLQMFIQVKIASSVLRDHLQ